MRLPLTAPVKPMLAQLTKTIPPAMAYEPKWDGYRCVVFRDGDEVTLFSRRGVDLTGYFPEVVAGVLDHSPTRCILDGELVVIRGDRLEFERLSERCQPGAVRIAHLARTMPACFIAWDLLALDDTDLTGRPLVERRTLLEAALDPADELPASAVETTGARGNPILLSPQTTDPEVARHWFDQFEGAGLDGVMAKPLDGRYLQGARAMYKVKHSREADVVVGAFVLHKNSSAADPLLGSLHFGLYADDDPHPATSDLHWVGVCSAFSEQARRQLLEILLPLTLNPGSPEYEAHPWSRPYVEGGARRPGMNSTWSKEKKDYYLLEPALVCQVVYEHMEGDRFRNTTRFGRWRPDKAPEDCTFEQLQEPVRYNLAEILANPAG